MNRREMLVSVGGGVSAALLTAAARGAPAPKTTAVGVCIHSYMIRPKVERLRGNAGAITDPPAFLEHCHRLGAGGIQIGIGVRDESYTARLRKRAEAYGMYVEGTAGLPREEKDVARFEATVRTAKAAGASVVRTVMMPGRRYEQFDSADAFRQAVERGRKSLELAEPVAARHKVHLAIENHKDQRAGERLAVLRHISSEYVGMCVDTANSIVLLEDPMEVVRAYAPWARAVHLKDQRFRECEDGFLAADVPLGDGVLDLAEMVRVLREARPQVRFSIEMHTRDALKVPCLTPTYWAAMADVPARDLARALQMVRAKASPEPFVQVSGMPLEKQLELEEANVRRSLAFARDRLGL